MVTHFTRVTPGHLNSCIQGSGGSTVEGESMPSKQLDGAWCAHLDVKDYIGYKHMKQYFLNDGFIKQIKPLSILFSVHAFGMSLTSSICEIVCLVQMAVDCCLTGQKPYFFVCCICNYKALPTVPSYSFSIRDQSIKWKLKKKKHGIRKSY